MADEVVAERDDETLPLSTMLNRVSGRALGTDNSARMLQVTADISVGGAQAIGGIEGPNLALLDEIMNEARVESPQQAPAEPHLNMGANLRRSISNPFIQTSR